MPENQFEIGYSWDAGLLREINEDSILYTSFNIRTHAGLISAGLFAVADGMGGHNAGEVASNLAVRTLMASCISNLIEEDADPPLSVLEDAFKEANSRILEAADNVELKGMGTTLTAALIIGADLYVAHIGDSRCYVINSMETIQVTKDHSVVQQLVDNGTITAEEARNHPRKNEITRVLGNSRNISLDLQKVKLYSGDNIMLCSDGLCGVVAPDKITETVISASGPDQACIDLTALANLAGGPDNISVIVVKPGNLPSWQAITAAETGVRRV